MTDTTTLSSPQAPVPVAPSKRRRAPSWDIWRIWVPLAIVLAYVAAAIFGPMLTSFDPIATATGDRLIPPGGVTSDGSTAILGTNQIGQDLLGQVLYGARISIAVGAATLLLAGVLGVAIGVVSGYAGGWVDGLLMRIADVQLAYPSILFAIFIAALIGRSVINVIIVLAISKWVVFARVARGQVLVVKDREYVDATRMLGARTWHLIRRCILPACAAPLLVVATVQLGHVILAEAALSFLGLGVPPGSPSWGSTIANGRDYLSNAWWISTIPGVVLAVLVTAFGLLGDALRDRYDPNLRNL